jgi:hypothetical protein
LVPKIPAAWNFHTEKVWKSIEEDPTREYGNSLVQKFLVALNKAVQRNSFDKNGGIKIK